METASRRVEGSALPRPFDADFTFVFVMNFIEVGCITGVSDSILPSPLGVTLRR
jgi:hypothetical protein